MLGLRGRGKRRNRLVSLGLSAILAGASSFLIMGGTAFAETHVEISTLSTAEAGEPVDVCIDAIDGQGNPSPLTGNRTVTFSSVPAATTTPAALTTYTGGDDCGNIFVFNTSGTYVITVTISGTDQSAPADEDTGDEPVLPIVPGTWTIKIVPGEFDELTCTVPASVVAGTPFSFTLTPRDEFGNVGTFGGETELDFTVTPEDAANVLPGTLGNIPGTQGPLTLSATMWVSGSIVVDFSIDEIEGEDDGGHSGTLTCPGILVTTAPAPTPAGGAAAAAPAATLPSFTG